MFVAPEPARPFLARANRACLCTDVVHLLMRIRVIKHEVVPACGSFEVRFPDGRPSRFFYWDDIAGRRLRADILTGADARLKAVWLARAAQDRLDSQSAH